MTDSPPAVFRSLQLVALCLVLSGLQVAHAADWPQWRGPNQDGVVSGDDVFGAGAFGLETAWGRSLGIAYSGISVVDGRVVTMFGDGESDFLIALDGASGEEIWRYRIADMFPSIGGSEGGPVSVPAIDDGVVYGLGAEGQLFAVDLEDGSEIWATNIVDTLKAQKPHFGFTTPPLSVGELLFLEAGGIEGRAFAGIDKKTGKVKWTAGDGTVAYQSPLLANLAGREQIVAVTNETVVGLDPRDGEILWSHEHATSEQDGAQSPVLIGDDRFILAGRSESAAFRISAAGKEFEIEEVWRTDSLKGSFAVPVFYDGYLYGFSGDFLTCVSPEDGTKVWKSRPPGGQGLIVVDGHLVIYGAGGFLVVVRATPKGYEERGRFQLSERGSYTYPSFADGTIYVRNTKEIAGVKVSADSTRASVKETAPTNEFERFLYRVAQSDNKRLLVDFFMKGQDSFPIVEDDRLVHFVYRGNAEDVAITGNMTELRVEEAMDHLDGTDLYYKTYPIEPGARWEYRLNVDFENPQPDPLNPRRVPGSRGDMSELVTAGWTEPDFLRPYEGEQRGRVESFELDSAALENTRTIHVYLPPGYDESRDRYQVLLFNDGVPWKDWANLPNSLDHLIGSSIEPIVVAFVDLPEDRARDEFGGERSRDYVTMLADELLPVLQRDYRVADTADAHAVAGSGSGAMMAVFAAIERPDAFGKSATCSAYLPDPLGAEVLAGIENGGESNVKFLVMWSRYEMHRKDWNVDFAEDSRRLSQALEAGGYEVQSTEVLDGAGWGGWRAQIGTVLEAFFPM